MLIRIFSRNGEPQVELSPNDNSTLVEEIQGDSILSLSFTHYAHIELDVDFYTDFEGKRYWLTEKYKPRQNNEKEWVYDIKFYGVESMLKRLLVVKRVDDDEDPLFTLTAPPREHVAMIVDCMNKGMGNISDWKVGRVEGVANIVVDYFGKYCDEALREIAEKTGAEWWVEGQTVNVCKCEHGETVALGYGNGLLSIDPGTADNVKFYTRLYPVGSSRNIDKEQYGHSRLQLPDGRKYVEVNADKYGRVDHYEQEAFSEIYPRRIGTVSNVRSEEVKGEDGNPFTIYYFKDDALPFDPNDYLMGDKVVRVSFQEGSELGGLGDEENGTYYFEVNFDSKTREFEIITIWPYDNGMQLPGDVLVPKRGDKYILWNLRMPDEYYAIAEEEFLEAVNKYNEEHGLDISVYRAPTDHVWIEQNKIDLSIGRRVRLESDEYFPGTGYRESRITKITRKVSLPSSMDIEISDALSRTSQQKMTDEITDTRHYVESLGNSVSLPDIIRTGDHTVATDNNLYSARRAEREFISKTGDDGTPHSLTIGKRLSSKGFREGMAGGQGWGIFFDENGKAVVETDFLRVREDLEVNALTANQVKAVGGMLIMTLADIVVSRVEESISGTSAVYRCFFEVGKDNNIGNLFRVDDVAYCHHLDPQNLDAKYYKRRVVGVGKDYIDVLVNGDVSGTGKPAEGDTVIAYGNYTDKNRQYVIIIDVRGGGYLRMLSGLNSVNATGREYHFVGHQSLDGSERFFAGNREGGQYIEYINGKFYIPGQLILGSDTGGGKTMLDYIKEQAGVKTYNRQPTPPYNSGDIWVNATFPDDGSIYSNEILRCRAGRNEGSFNIEDWELANGYTAKIDTFQYLKKALTQRTEIGSGLILTSLIQLGLWDREHQTVYSGLNGMPLTESDDKDYIKKGLGIAAWYGGDMLDGEVEKWVNPSQNRYAQSLFRFDGSGYLAGGNISWDNLGNGSVGKDSKGNPVISWDSKGVTLSDTIKLGTSSETLSGILSFMNKVNNMFTLIENGDGTKYIQANYDGFYSNGFVSAKGKNNDAGQAGGLLDFQYQGSGNVVTDIRKSGSTVTVTYGNISQGLDTAALASYLTTNNYARKSDITSALTGYLTSAEAKTTYVTALGLNGNQLTWTKNGVNNPITIPFATNADTLDSLHAHSFMQTFSQNETIDLNDATTSGTYRLGFTNLNTPEGDTGKYAEVLVIRGGWFNDGMAQLYCPYSQNTAWYRTGIVKDFVDESDTRYIGNRKWRELAFTDSTVEAAKRLETSWNIWGQPFNGTGNVTGDMSSVGNITMYGSIQQTITYTGLATATLASLRRYDPGSNTYGARLLIEARHTGAGYNIFLQSDDPYANYTRHLVLNADNGNVGIGTTNPTYKFHVSGTAYISGLLTAPSGIKIGNCEITWDGTGLKFSEGIYSEKWVSAKGVNASGSDSGGGVSYNMLQSWSDYNDSKSGYVLSAGLGFDLYTNSVRGISFNGTGNVVTGIGKSNSMLNVSLGSVSYLSGWGDNRSVSTTPNDYNNKFAIAGLKTVNKPDSNTYAFVLGFRGWSDNTGGNAWELGFTNSGIYARKGSTTSWEDWNRFVLATDLSAYVKKSGDTMTGELTVPRININATSSTAYISANNASNWFVSIKDRYLFVVNESENCIRGGQGENNKLSLGTSSVRWSNVYSVLGNFSGQVTSTVATGTSPFSIASTTLCTNLNADLLDGKHNGDLTAENVRNQGTVDIVSGTTMFSSGLRLYSVYNNGYPATYGNLIRIGGAGCGELFAQWQGSNALGSLYYRSKRDNTSSEWSAWGQIAYITSNVASATQLQNTRTLWGQNFNGTQNVSGNMTGVGNIIAVGESRFTVVGGTYADPAAGIQSAMKMTGVLAQSGGNVLLCTSSGNVGIGMTDPSCKLHINGDLGLKFSSGSSLRIWSGSAGSSSYVSFDNSYGTGYNNIALCSLGGNVGIGTSTPGYKLTVNGTMRVESMAGFGNNISIDGSTIIFNRANGPTYFNAAKEGSYFCFGVEGAATNLASSIFVIMNTGVYSNGYVSAKGQNTSSDGRLKDIKGAVNLSLAQIAHAPSVMFKWKKDGTDDFGSIAQYWQNINPLFAREDFNDYLSLDYGKLALVSVIEVAKEVMNDKTRIKELERRVDELEKNLNL